MAYRLPGLNKAYDEDYVNDREFNAGHKILTHLIDTNEKVVAIFMIRYYGGVHLGNRHFEIHIELVKKALADLKANTTFTSEIPSVQDDHKPKKAHRSKPHFFLGPR